MAIPCLLSSGVLPTGLHDATLADVGLRFGSANATRQGLQSSLVQLVNTVRPTKYFVDLVVDGSYVTDKTSPGDIDVVFRSINYWASISALNCDPNLSWLTYPDEVKRRYNIDVFFEDVGGTQVEFFSTMRPVEALARGLLPQTQRGLVRVIL